MIKFGYQNRNFICSLELKISDVFRFLRLLILGILVISQTVMSKPNDRDVNGERDVIVEIYDYIVEKYDQ